MTNPVLAERVRSALATLARVEERKMFGGIGFMVDGKLCVSVGAHRLMCRIDPATHEKALEHEGVQTVTMNGRQYKGYVHVAEEAVADDADLHRWIRLALDYNARAKRSKGRATHRAGTRRRASRD